MDAFWNLPPGLQKKTTDKEGRPGGGAKRQWTEEAEETEDEGAVSGWRERRDMQILLAHHLQTLLH